MMIGWLRELLSWIVGISIGTWVLFETVGMVVVIIGVLVILTTVPLGIVPVLGLAGSRILMRRVRFICVIEMLDGPIALMIPIETSPRSEARAMGSM